jgi:hypothetical protein
MKLFLLSLVFLVACETEQDRLLKEAQRSLNDVNTALHSFPECVRDAVIEHRREQCGRCSSAIGDGIDSQIGHDVLSVVYDVHCIYALRGK